MHFHIRHPRSLAGSNRRAMKLSLVVYLVSQHHHSQLRRKSSIGRRKSSIWSAAASLVRARELTAFSYGGPPLGPPNILQSNRLVPPLVEVIHPVFTPVMKGHWLDVLEGFSLPNPDRHSKLFSRQQSQNLLNPSSAEYIMLSHFL